MKKILFMMLVALGFTACGGDNDENPYSVTTKDELYALTGILSFDGKYVAAIRREDGLFGVYPASETGKTIVNPANKVWEHPLEEIIVETDLGYGEVEINKYLPHVLYFFQGTYNTILMYNLFPTNIELHFYDETGKFLNAHRVKGTTDVLKPCPWNETLCAVVEEVCTEEDHRYDKIMIQYHLFDKNGNKTIVRQITSLMDNFLGYHFTKVNASSEPKSKYLCHDDDSLLAVSIENGIIKKKNTSDIGKYITDELYKDEEKEPRYTIKEIKPGSESSVVIMDLVLYSGDKHTVEINVDNNTGNVIK